MMSGMTVSTTAMSAVAPATRHHQSGYSGAGNAAGIARTSAVSQPNAMAPYPAIRDTCGVDGLRVNGT